MGGNEKAKRNLLVARDPRTGLWFVGLRDVAVKFRRAIGRALSGTAFPNDLGNYRGKRKPGPQFNGGKPLTPAERFARVQQLYLEKRRTYRFRIAGLKGGGGR